MRVISATHWMVACALALGACAMDDPPPGDDSPMDRSATVDNAMASASTSAEASADTPGDVAVPEELSFENLPDPAIQGDQGDHGSCRIRIVSCGGHHRNPRYCTYGYCKYEPRIQARRRCYDECGRDADCGDLRYTGRCDHRLGGDEDLAPDGSQI